jgi:6-phosphogluconate dehydrogenase (decarboxylating)
MKLAMVGLGRMGANMARRLARGGAAVIGQDVSDAARGALADEARVTTVDTLDALAAALPAPRVVWLMLPAGAVTEQALARLAALLAPGDVVVEGGNANYRDSMRRAGEMAARGIDYVDAGVSGGIWGLANGYTLTLGGTGQAVARVVPFARLLAPAPDAGAALRPLRERALREDGPQRHRVRRDAGLRGGPRAARRQARARAGPGGDRASVAPRQRDPVVAARSRRRGARREA